jgi:hypothetical protein
VRERIPGLDRAPDEAVLLLRKYWDAEPWCFYDPVAFDEASTSLEKSWNANPDAVVSGLNASRSEISRASLALDEENRYLGMTGDQPWPTDEFDKIVECRAIVLRYFSLVERALSGYIFPFMQLSGENVAGVQTANQRCDFVRRRHLAAIADVLVPIVRNAVGHGSYEYADWRLVVTDVHGSAKKRRDLDATAIFLLYDHLVDVCNAAEAAFDLFFARHGAEIRSRDGLLPMRYVVAELRESAALCDWQVADVLDVRLTDPGQSQLLIGATCTGRNPLMTSLGSARTVAIAEELMPGYDMYRVAVRNGNGPRQIHGFRGSDLRGLRETGNADIAAYVASIDWELSFDPSLRESGVTWAVVSETAKSEDAMPSHDSSQRECQIDGYRVYIMRAQQSWVQLGWSLFVEVVGDRQLTRKWVRCHLNDLADACEGMAPGIRGTSDRVALSVYDRRLRLRDMDAPFPLRDAFVVGERVGEPSHRLLRFFDGWTEEVVRDTWHVFWNEELDATIDDWLEYYDLPETDRAGR